MVDNISVILIPQTLLIILALHLMHILNSLEYIAYVALFVVIYFISYLYFQLVIFVFKERPKMNAKERKDLVMKLYKVYFISGQFPIFLVLFNYIDSWNKDTLMYLMGTYLILITLIFLSVKLSLWIVEKPYLTKTKRK